MRISLMFIIYTLILFSSSCTNEKSVIFNSDQTKIKYIYSSQIIINEFSIKRKVQIENTKINKSIEIQLMDDIEFLDEPRFFLAESISYDNVNYKDILIIEDPFAFALIELDQLKVLYNSHGEDDVHTKLSNVNNKICLGKIRKNTFYQGNCEIEF